ncbi:MAG: M20/M25/M40 family metallo-hydrolase, partial [Verrucomicrobia bacterium]
MAQQSARGFGKSEARQRQGEVQRGRRRELHVLRRARRVHQAGQGRFAGCRHAPSLERRQRTPHRAMNPEADGRVAGPGGRGFGPASGRSPAFGTRHRETPRILLAFLVLAWVFPIVARAASPDFGVALEETVRNLSALVRTDTVSPPGNETRAAEFLKAILEREGIPAEILAVEPARGNLVARLKGSGKRRPLLLMGHTDVVGVEREKWTVDPFGAVQKDGFLYGRGAMDDKGMTVSLLEVFVWLRRLKVPLDRDVVFLACAGEESNTQVGIDFMVKEHWDKIACEFAFNEGGRIREEQGAVKYVGVATAEKVPR